MNDDYCLAWFYLNFDRLSTNELKRIKVLVEEELKKRRRDEK